MLRRPYKTVTCLKPTSLAPQLSLRSILKACQATLARESYSTIVVLREPENSEATAWAATFLAGTVQVLYLLQVTSERLHH